MFSDIIISWNSDNEIAESKTKYPDVFSCYRQIRLRAILFSVDICCVTSLPHTKLHNLNNRFVYLRADQDLTATKPLSLRCDTSDAADV